VWPSKSLHFYLLDFLEDVRPIHLPHNNLPLFFLHVHVTFAASDRSDTRMGGEPPKSLQMVVFVVSP